MNGKKLFSGAQRSSLLCWSVRSWLLLWQIWILKEKPSLHQNRLQITKEFLTNQIIFSPLPKASTLCQHYVWKCMDGARKIGATGIQVGDNTNLCTEPALKALQRGVFTCCSCQTLNSKLQKAVSGEWVKDAAFMAIEDPVLQRLYTEHTLAQGAASSAGQGWRQPGRCREQPEKV